MESSTRHTCLKLELTETVFVKATWHPTRFDLSITDGQLAWSLNATEDEVRERASQWDQPVSEYIDLAERYLGFQQPGSVYAFVDAGSGNMRLSWTFEKEGTKLEWRWKCKPSPDSKKTTTEIMDFLMDANILKDYFHEEVVIKTQSCERLKEEAEKCLAQSEKFSNEKTEFENAIYDKFVGVLNAKKSKLRDLRDQLLKPGNSGKAPEDEEEVSTDKTETYNGESDDVKSEKEGTSENRVGTSKEVTTSKRRGRKRK